jgi:hypothetical protein
VLFAAVLFIAFWSACFVTAAEVASQFAFFTVSLLTGVPVRCVLKCVNKACLTYSIVGISLYRPLLLGSIEYKVVPGLEDARITLGTPSTVVSPTTLAAVLDPFAVAFIGMSAPSGTTREAAAISGAATTLPAPDRYLPFCIS